MRLLVLGWLLLFSLQGVAQPTERADWKRLFADHGATGTLLVLDGREPARPSWVFDAKRASTQFSPASTFKIPHTLFALDAGAVSDEFQRFEWDGVERSFPPHNQDQDLRSAMRNSAVWVYQGFSRVIGPEKAAAYLQAIEYGNRQATAASGDYWIDGDLAISAEQQLVFLERLYRNDLSFAVEHQRLVKDVMIVEAGRDWILRAKTGWDGRIGWWVGWVEWPTGPVFFALNIDTPNRLEDLYKREAIARQGLRSMGALPQQ